MTSPSNLLQLADEYAKAYFMGRGDEARKRLQAAIIVAETEALKAEQAAAQAARDEATRVCDARWLSLSKDNKFAEANEAHKCGSAIGGNRPSAAMTEPMFVQYGSSHRDNCES